MKRIFALILLAGAMLAGANAQTPDPWRTGVKVPMRNGRWWNASDESQKIAYLAGFSEGLFIGTLRFSATFSESGAVPDSSKTFKAINGDYLAKGTGAELVASLNSFYADPANRPIAIVAALRWIQDRFAGASVADLEALAQQMRSGADDLRGSTK